MLTADRAVSCGLVNRIDVVPNHRRAHNFFMTVIRLSGSQLHAARVLVGLSREEVAERAGLCRHSIGKRETSNHVLGRDALAPESENKRSSPSGLFLGL